MNFIDPKPLYHKYRPFIRKRQLHKLLLVTLLRWLLSAAIVGAMYGVLASYSNRETLRKHRQIQFNALIVALSIALSLNLASSLKAMAGQLRWWALSLREWPIAEADLILQCEHLRHVAKMVFVSKLCVVRLVAVCWILINLAFQAAVATLGVTWMMEPADTFNMPRSGLVSIPVSYGLVPLPLVRGNLGQIPKPGTIFDPGWPLIFCGPGSCAYTFYESAVDEGTSYAAVATNRTVTTSAECRSWPVKEGGDGTKLSIILDDHERTNVTIPAANGESQTTFMANLNTGMGPDWSSIAAFEASATDPWFYRCQVTVGPVLNAVLPEHELGETVSSMAASAIARQGYGTSQSVTSDDTTQQFQSYPAESTFGDPQGGNTTGMATLLAGFSTGVVAVTAQQPNPIQHALRGAPQAHSHGGVRLRKNGGWRHVSAVLGSILGAQLVLGVAAALVANTVVVRGHSHLGMAHLLRSVSQKLSYYRCHGVHEKDGATMHGPEPTLRYRQSRVGDYSFETDCEMDPII